MRVLFVILVLFLAGCATDGGYREYLDALERERSERQAAAQSCETDLCRVVLGGGRGVAAPPPSPAWGLLDRLIMVGIPAAVQVQGSRDNRRLWGSVVEGFASMPTADNSITVGGNFGDTRWDESDHSVWVGGNLGDTRGDEFHGDYWRGRDFVGRDYIGDDFTAGDRFDVGRDIVGGDRFDVGRDFIGRDRRDDNSRVGP